MAASGTAQEHQDAPRAPLRAPNSVRSSVLGAAPADLVRTMRHSARWRWTQAQRFDDRTARLRSHRAMVAISIAAKFVEQLDPDDRDLAWLRYVDAQDGRVELCESSRELLSRFGMDPGAWRQPSVRSIRLAWWSTGPRWGLTDELSAPCWSVRRIPTHGMLTPCGN